MSEPKVRTINIVELFKFIDAVRRGFSNKFHGHGGTYVIAGMFGATTPAEVQSFWAEVQRTIGAGQTKKIRTVQYDPDALGMTESPGPMDGLDDEQKEDVDRIIEAMKNGRELHVVDGPYVGADGLSLGDLEETKKFVAGLREKAGLAKLSESPAPPPDNDPNPLDDLGRSGAKTETEETQHEPESGSDEEGEAATQTGS